MYTKHLRPLMSALQAGERVFILAGPPGTGKTSFAHWWADEIGAEVISYLCHSWSSDEDLFNGVSVAAVVRGDAENAVQKGVLRIAGEKSFKGSVVLLIDELDKAPARFEALLLEFLERWEYPIAPGVKGRAVSENVWVFITHNGAREVSAPLQRRAFRYVFPFLPGDVETSLLGGGPLAAALVRVANAMRAMKDVSPPSLSELRRAKSILPFCSSVKEAAEVLTGCLAKDEAGETFLRKRAAALWDLTKR